MRLDLRGLNQKPPFIIAPADDPGAVEDIIGQFGVTVGDSWWASDPADQQADGRWKLYVVPSPARRERKSLL